MDIKGGAVTKRKKATQKAAEEDDDYDFNIHNTDPPAVIKCLQLTDFTYQDWLLEMSPDTFKRYSNMVLDNKNIDRIVEKGIPFITPHKDLEELVIIFDDRIKAARVWLMQRMEASLRKEFYNPIRNKWRIDDLHTYMNSFDIAHSITKKVSTPAASTSNPPPPSAASAAVPMSF